MSFFCTECSILRSGPRTKDDVCAKCVEKRGQNPQAACANGSAVAPGSISGRVFTVGELWGPFPCEGEGCRDMEVYSILLTEEEKNKLPEQSGPLAVTYIFDNKLGTALCDNCLKAARQ